jgi:hypothetical protein
MYEEIESRGPSATLSQSEQALVAIVQDENSKQGQRINSNLCLNETVGKTTQIEVVDRQRQGQRMIAGKIRRRWNMSLE